MVVVGTVVLIGLFLLADYTPPWLLRGGYVLVALTTVLIIVGLLQRGRSAAAFGAWPLRPLGLISYSLYLVHWPVVLILTAHSGGLDGIALMLAMVGASIAVAVLLHLTVERPVRRMSTPDLPTIAAGVGAVSVVTMASLVLL
jgi:peptidoglycan/LPS O-acetylase OafA/YrhL